MNIFFGFIKCVWFSVRTKSVGTMVVVVCVGFVWYWKMFVGWIIFV